MSDLSSLGLAHPIRPELAIGLVVAAGLAVWWAYHRNVGWKFSVRSGLAGLRLLALLLIGLAILQPVLRQSVGSQAMGTVVVGVDVSASMAMGDGSQSRLGRAKEQLMATDGMLARLHASGAQVRLFAFGEQTREIPESAVPGLAAADEATDIGSAIRTMGEAVRGTAGTAMILLTDAGDTTDEGPLAAARRAAGSGTSVHLVGFGGAANSPDVSISNVIAPPVVEVGANTEIQVEVGRQHYTGPVAVRLYRGDTFLTQTEVPAGADGMATCSLGLVPSQAGTLDLRVEAEPVPGEKALDNNKRDFRITAEERRVDVLFVEGSPRHEFAFIRRTMSDDTHFRLVTLLRLGHKRYANNGADDGSVLGDGFPTTADALQRYSAIILSDIEAAEFTSDQLQMIHDFVTVRGGGLLMLGGTNAFNLGGYAGTPVAELLPVSLDPADTASTFDDRQFTFEVTPEGLGHEILRQGRTTEATEAQWRVMPPLKGLNVLTKAKPGASVLAVRPGSPQSVVLAVQDVGAGRVAAFASANSWRWKMLREVDDDSYRRFWSQMIRWLAVGNKQLLAIEVSHQIVGIHQEVGITARVLDATHRPSNAATVVASVTDPNGHVQQLAMPWILSEDGAYQASFLPELPGNYQIAIAAALPKSTPITATSAVLAIKATRETSRPGLDLATARAIAEAGNGTLQADGDGRAAVEAALERLGSKSVPVSVMRQRELGDSSILLLLTALILIAEWALRRRSGLT